MQKKFVITALLLICALFISAAGINWQHDIESALAQAKVEKKHVFVFFTGSDWCSWCHKLTDEVFDHQVFQEYVKNNMVMVELDFPRSSGIISEAQKSYNNQKQQEYGIQGYPSVLILDSQGNIAVRTGYRDGGPEEYVKFLQESISWTFDTSNSTWQDPQGLVWQKNLETALEMAKADQKHILINFTGSDWCIWCHRISDEIFAKPEFVDFAENELVLVRFDFPKKSSLPAGEENYNRQKAQQYGIRGFPTLLLMDAQGSIVQKLGYEKGGAVPYVEMLRDLMK